MTDIKEVRERLAKSRQSYDGDPPRCFTCVYMKREVEQRFATRRVAGRSGKVRVAKFNVKGSGNHTTDRCTYGNFNVSHKGVCDEWRNSNGEVIGHD